MQTPTLNEPWEKSLQHLQATITGLNANLANLHIAIDAMPEGLLPPGEMAVPEMRANELNELREFLELLMGCACAHADAHMCYAIRYNRDTLDLEDDEECQCYCHSEWDEDEEGQQP